MVTGERVVFSGAVLALVLGLARCGGGRTQGEVRMAGDVVRVLVEDMTVPNAIRPHGIEGANWAKAPRVGQGDTWPEGWTCGLMWGQVYLASDGSPATNVRVAIREPAYWILSRKTGRWTRVQYTVEPEGAAYREDFVNDENTRIDARKEADGSVAVRLLPGYNYHFWPKAARVVVDPADVAGQVSLFFARLVVDDPAKPDDRDRARLIASCGGDHWRALDSQWKADWSNNGDWAIGRFKLLTAEWQVFTACSMTAEDLRRSPPPLHLAP